MKEPLLQGNLLFFLLTETLVLLTSLLWVFRSHYWITSMVVFHSGNPKSSKCFSHKHFPPRTFMAFYSQALSYYATPFECEKRPFRAHLGLWPASPRRLSSDLMSNRLGSRSISGWEADQLHKCAVWQARGFCTPQPRICARCTKIWRACARFPWARCAFEFFSQFCIVLALLLCCGVNPCAMNDCFSVLMTCRVLVALCGRNFSDNIYNLEKPLSFLSLDS